MSSFRSTLERELFVPVSPAQAYSALRTVASGKYKLKREDDFTMSLIFKSTISAFTYGEKIAAQVVAADGGSTIRLTISPNVPGQLAQEGKNRQIADRVFAGVAAILEAAPRE
jgi:hypothetical protein